MPNTTEIDYSKVLEIAKLAVGSVHKKFQYTEFDELFSYATLCLVKQLPKYDPNRCALNTFVTMVCRRAAYNALRSRGRAVVKKTKIEAALVGRGLSVGEFDPDTLEDEDVDLIHSALALVSEGKKPSECRKVLKQRLRGRGLTQSQIDEKFASIAGRW